MRPQISQILDTSSTVAGVAIDDNIGIGDIDDNIGIVGIVAIVGAKQLPSKMPPASSMSVIV